MSRRLVASGRAAGVTVWLTGLPGSGKSTLARRVQRVLEERSVPAFRLDGDDLRGGLSSDLGFCAADRSEQARRAAHVAVLLAAQGAVVVVSLVSPYAADRRAARQLHLSARVAFYEVYVDTPLETCERRDRKGLYARARAGRLSHMTGIGDPYEPPANPELVVAGDDVAAHANRVVDLVGRGSARVLGRPGGE